MQPWSTIYAISNTRQPSSLNCPSHLYSCRESSTNQLLFMQNKPNLLDAQMNVSAVKTKDYENKPRLPAPGKQTQSKPISNVSNPRGFKRTYTCPAFRVVRSRNPAHQANVTVLRHNSYNNHRFCSGGSSKTPEV